MDKPISERFVKLSSRLPFPDDLELGQDVDIVIYGHMMTGTVLKTEDLDQQDGTINRVYTIKFLQDK